MKCRIACFVAVGLASVLYAAAQEDQALNKADDAFDVANAYQQIVADYQRIEATRNAAARAAASRLVGLAYRNVIDRAKEVKELGADDLYALAACHEGLNQLSQAKQHYARSLEAKATARTHLALVRVNLKDDLTEADAHFAAAAKLDPQYPGLAQFRLALAGAHVGQRNWSGAVAHLRPYAAYTKALADRQPGSAALQAAHEAIEKRLESLERFVELTGKPAPPLAAQHWVQGEPVELAQLAGKPVLVDFCAMWAVPSRARIERMQKMHAKYADQGLEVIGVTLAYGHSYDPETDEVDTKANRAPADERADLAVFAKKHGIGYRLAIIERATTDQYAVNSLPHTVLLDKQGRVKMILQAGGKEDEAELEATVRELLGGE